MNKNETIVVSQEEFFSLRKNKFSGILNLEGNIHYLKDGLYHNDFGPAVLEVDGYKAWYKEGQRHREDGPAIIRKDGKSFFYLNNVFLEEVDFNKQKLKNIKESLITKELKM